MSDLFKTEIDLSQQELSLLIAGLDSIIFSRNVQLVADDLKEKLTSELEGLNLKALG